MKISNHKRSLKNTVLKLFPHLPGVNELKSGLSVVHHLGQGDMMKWKEAIFCLLVLVSFLYLAVWFRNNRLTADMIDDLRDFDSYPDYPSLR